MLYLEESVESILAEEGQDLLGLAFLTETLGLNMKKMELLFRKSALQYSRRRPIEETRTIDVSMDTSSAAAIMPEGIRAIKAVRYGVLDQLPRYYMDSFGELSYEYEATSRILKVWPPISPVRITYTRDLYITKTRQIVGSSAIPAGETYYLTELPCSPLVKTFSLSLGDYSLEVTDTYTETIPTADGEEKQEIWALAGSMGSGTYNVTTRELEINFDSEDEELLNGGTLVYTYYPKYYLLPDIGLEDEIFNKLFASKILEALASLRSQATQEVLHNIDLTTDELYTRVRVLKRELNTLLRNTIKFSGMAHI